jgi:phosphatidylglycerophosphate synthase
MAKQRKHWHEREEFEGAARVSDGMLRRLGFFARLPPNLVTLAGGILAVPMVVAFLRGRVAIGAILYSVSMLTDWIDGALARYQKRVMPPDEAAHQLTRNRWLRLGPTELGKVIDPVTDKIRYFAALFPLGWHILPHALIWTAFGLAAALTFFREVVRWIWGLKPGANAVGKYKVHVEVVVIACLVLQQDPWAPFFYPALILCLISTALGAGSFLTQGQSIRGQVREIRNHPLPTLKELILKHLHEDRKR